VCKEKITNTNEERRIWCQKRLMILTQFCFQISDLPTKRVGLEVNFVLYSVNAPQGHRLP
jgi:hypothetical protein